jgi:hypothetical protein
VDYDVFYATLDDSCADNATITNAAGVLEFTPDEDTPDVLYYQCVTHQNLGWKIVIVNANGTGSSPDGPPDKVTSGTVGRASYVFALGMSLLLATSAAVVAL